jgi:AcrR family transcriptional regulator
MGRPPNIPGALHTRDRVIAAAVDVFARDGFERATLADIARAAGISRPSVLHHFESKDALYDEVVTGVFTRLGAVVTDAFGAGGSFEDRLRHMCLAYSGFLAAHPAEARLVAREVVEGDGPGAALLRERAAPLLDAVTSWIAAGPVAPVSVRHAILWVVSDGLLAAAAGSAPGSLGHLLWGPPDADRTWALARSLLLARSLEVS